MKKILLLMCVTNLGYAQFSVAPSGSSGGSKPPVGKHSKDTECFGNNFCSLKIQIYPYCFGTNLRAYSQETQLRPNENVDTNLAFTSASGNDKFEITFPAGLTHAADGVRVFCSPLPSSNLATPGEKDIVCPIGQNANAQYRISGWRISQNPSCYANGGSHGQEYCKFASRTVNGVIATAVPDADSKVICTYVFNSSYQIESGRVSCFFPSRAPDYAGQVIIKKDGVDISNNVKLKAYTNSISFLYQDKLNSVTGTVAVKNGVIQNPPPPGAVYENKQGEREIFTVYEKNGFDSNNANKTYTMIMKFPGAEGFCGGYYSPLMFFFDKKYPQFSGISTFPLYGIKEGGRVNWPEEKSPGFFLVYLNQDKQVSKAEHLFGQNDKFSNGFEALKIYDENKDDVIDSKDKIFSALQLWSDGNSNGTSEDGELFSLKDKGVISIDLKYRSNDLTKFKDKAKAREKSKFSFKKNGKPMVGEVFDVWFTPID